MADTGRSTFKRWPYGLRPGRGVDARQFVCNVSSAQRVNRTVPPTRRCERRELCSISCRRLSPRRPDGRHGGAICRSFRAERLRMSTTCSRVFSAAPITLRIPANPPTRCARPNMKLDLMRFRRRGAASVRPDRAEDADAAAMADGIVRSLSTPPLETPFSASTSMPAEDGSCRILHGASTGRALKCVSRLLLDLLKKLIDQFQFGGGGGERRPTSRLLMSPSS